VNPFGVNGVQAMEGRSMTPHPDPQIRQFSVHASEDAPSRAHLVEERSFEAAAMRFCEEQHPYGDLFGEAAVLVEDCETGERQCFRIDLGSGDAEPCE
jgi:hypothetical protein